MTRQRYDVLIVGGGHAGAQAAVALRQNKLAGTIAIVGDEPDLPYERPPLSKDYFSGSKTFERILIRPASFWQEKSVRLLLGHRVTKVEADDHVVRTADGLEIGYGTLIWATGGSPRRLTCSGHDVIGVHGVRTRADVDRMMAELPDVRNVCVIGGGYIGLESAAVLVKLGRKVTVLEAQSRVLARVAGEPLSRFYEAEHRSRGVDVRLNAAVECIEEADGKVRGVRLASGETIACEMVIVGIGIVPAVQPLVDAGAVGMNGVDVDETCRTSLPDVYAIGDCANHENRFAAGVRLRLESVQNANDQAMTVARALTGAPSRYDATPWFWSNQYDLRLQTVGLSTGFDFALVRGDVSSRSFSIVYYRGEAVVALDCVNATKDYVQGRKLVETAARAPMRLITDVTVPLKDLVENAQGVVDDGTSGQREVGRPA